MIQLLKSPTLLGLLTTLSLSHAGDGLLLDLTLPPREGDRFLHAEFSCWLPDAEAEIKAIIIHQHGCTNASPEKHPPISHDWHWRSLARKHEAALLVPMYQVAKNCDEWNDPDSGSEQALFTALEDFSIRAKRPELKSVPWVLWGHSGGSSWSAQMILRHPQRVLAASFRGGCSKQFGVPEFRAQFLQTAHALPLLFIWGQRESAPPSKHFVSWVPMNTMYRELRSAGGKVCRVIDPRSEHGCDDSRFMSLNFFDAVLSGHTQPGALRDIETLESRHLTEANVHDAALTWLPNEEFAKLWQEFSKSGTLMPHTAPSQAPHLLAQRSADGSVTLTWQLQPTLMGGIRAIRIHRDGVLWKQYALSPTDFLATSRDSTPEPLRAMQARDESRAAHTYTLTFLDAANHESPPSLPTQVPGNP